MTTDVIARLRLMHKPRTERPGSCCIQCGIVWPCPTSKVLDEAPAPADLPAPADRYRLAWQSARGRAQAYGEGILRVVEDRESYQGWLRDAEGQIAVLLRRLADEAQHPEAGGRIPLPGIPECGPNCGCRKAEGAQR